MTISNESNSHYVTDRHEDRRGTQRNEWMNERSVLIYLGVYAAPLRADRIIML